MTTRKTWTEQHKIDLLGMVELGYTLNEICEKLDRTPHSVQNRLARYAFQKTFGDRIKWQAVNETESDLDL